MRQKRLLCGVILVISAVLFAPAASAQTPAPALATPDSQGLSKERLGRIAEVMKREIEKGTIPGAITLIARDGKIVHYETHGFADAAKSRPIQKARTLPRRSREAGMTYPLTRKKSITP